MKPTPTPRTDAAEILWNDTGLCVVPAEFARYLERELAAKDAHADEIYKAAVNLAAKLEADLAELTQSLAFQTQLNREVIEREKQTFADLATERAEHEETVTGARMLADAYSAERELADRLAIAIEQVLPAFGAGGDLSKAWDAWDKARK